MCFMGLQKMFGQKFQSFFVITRSLKKFRLIIIRTEVFWEMVKFHNVKDLLCKETLPLFFFFFFLLWPWWNH